MQLRNIILVGLVLCPALLFASGVSIEDLRMEKRFGIGIDAGGPLGMFGTDIDINVTPDFSVSGGIGTGLDYTTLMAKCRYFLTGKKVSPYIGAGIARWYTSAPKSHDLAPGLLERFLENSDLSQGFSVVLIYPTLGFQFLHRSGFEFSGEVQYLFQLFNFANAAYAGMGVHWYF